MPDLSRAGQPAYEDYKQHVQALIRAALRAVEPGRAVRRHLHFDGEIVSIGKEQIRLTPEARIWLVGAGKAGVAMGHAALELLGDRVQAGVLSVPALPESESGPVAWIRGGHPIPNSGSVEAGKAIQKLLQGTRPEDLVLALISGGGSALMELPAGDLTLDDFQAVTEALLRSGARIDEINTVRQQLSQIKGGGLAAMASPARVVSMILSDVVGDPVEFIASGPTAQISTDAAQAQAVLERYGLIEVIPAIVKAHLVQAQRVSRPSAGAQANVIIGSNRLAALAAREAAAELGFETLLLTNFLQGEAREVGQVIAALARQMAVHAEPIRAPGCLILGGETTVQVRGAGLGGRNQELALAAAIGLEGHERLVVVAFGTDGVDGPTPAAGAVVRGETSWLARQNGMQPEQYLADNDSHRLLAALDADLRIGPTGTNVNDLVFVLHYAG